MSEHFISRQDAEKDLLSCAAYLAERIKSIEGHAEAMSAVVPQYIARENVDLAAELANSVDDPFTRDRLLIAVAEKCAEMDDDEYALQLVDAVEEPALRSQAFERIALQKAAQGELEKAREVADSIAHPDGVFVGIAVKQSSLGLEDDAKKTVDEIEHAGSAVTALVEIAMQRLHSQDAEAAVKYLELAAEEAGEIEHTEERARAYCDIGTGFIEAGRNDRAIETFDKARSTAETIDNIHRDAFLSLTAQGFLRAGSLDLADRTLDLVSDKTHMASCLLAYSREFWKKDDRDEALESLEEAYAILESQHERETRDSRSRFRLLTSIAAQFAGFEKGERAIEIAEKIKDEGERTSALSQIAAVLTFRKEDDQARHALRSIADDGDRVFALIGMSDAKERIEEREAAAELLREASDLADEVQQLKMRAAAYTELAKRAGALNDEGSFEKAINRNLEVISMLKDSSTRVSALADVSRLVDELGLTIPESEQGRLVSILQASA